MSTDNGTTKFVGWCWVNNHWERVCTGFSRGAATRQLAVVADQMRLDDKWAQVTAAGRAGSIQTRERRGERRPESAQPISVT